MPWNKTLFGLLLLCQLPGLGMGRARADSVSELAKEFAWTMDESLPKGAVARLGTLRFRHPGTIRSLAVSPDGSLIASAGGSSANKNAHAVYLWDRRSGINIGRLVGHTAAPRAVAFSPDGNLLASMAQVFYIKEPKTPLENGEEGAIFEIRLWSLKTGKVRSFVFGKTGFSYYLHINFSPDGKTIACSSDSDVWFLEVKSGRPWRHWDGGGVVDFSPNRGLIGSFYGDGLIIRDLIKGEKIGKFTFPCAVLHFAFLGENRLVFSESDGQIHWLDLPLGKVNKTINGYLGALSPDKKYGALFRGDKIILFDLQTAKEIKNLPGGEIGEGHHSFGVVRLDKGFLALSQGSAIVLLETRTGKKGHGGGEHCGEIQLANFSSKWPHFISVGKISVRLWDIERKTQLKCNCPGNGLFVVSPSLSPNRKTLVALAPSYRYSWYKAFRLEVSSFSFTTLWGGKRALFDWVRISPDGKLVAVGESSRSGKPDEPDQVLLIDLATGKEQGRLPPGNYRYEVAALLPGEAGFVEAYSEDIVVHTRKKTRRLFHLFFKGGSDEETTVFFGTKVAFSSDMRLVAAPSPNPKEQGGIWEMASGRKVAALPLFCGPARSVRFFGNQRLAVGSWDGLVSVWEIPSGKKLGHFNGQRGSISCLDFSEDGQHLASGSDDSSILVWKVPILAKKKVCGPFRSEKRNKKKYGRPFFRRTQGKPIRKSGGWWKEEIIRRPFWGPTYLRLPQLRKTWHVL